MTKNRDETMILIIPTPLINGEGLRHDCNPSEALLRLYSHPGTAIHIALEHTLHIAGIPTGDVENLHSNSDCGQCGLNLQYY